MHFYELHEGDDDVFADLLLVQEADVRQQAGTDEDHACQHRREPPPQFDESFTDDGARLGPSQQRPRLLRPP